MSATYSKVLQTKDGPVHIVTKQRSWGFLSIPHTSVMPHRTSQLKQLGTLIKWNTADPTILADLHDKIARLVQERGVAGLADIAESVKMAQRAGQQFGQNWQEIVQQARGKGIAFPPNDVLKYVKSFM